MTEISRIDPNPRIVWLMDYALDAIIPRLRGQIGNDFAPWIEWAKAWRAGQRSPQRCVDVAHECFARKDDDPLAHTLGQLAWGAKEACYSSPTSGWLVIRYIADAMVAFGIAYPDDHSLMLGPPAAMLSAAEGEGK